MSTAPEPYPRHVAPRLRVALADTPDDFEVDIVLEQGRTAVAGVEVKAAASVNDSDLRGLRKLRDAAGPRFKSGVVLYDGTATIAFGGNLYALPLRTLWEGARARG